ncbi:protein NEDD1-like isoform X2 [Rhincodon typus]|uniref:protein NEDD1-like isoform X2 n=1 Tax=Rhincodon typus TaxID=259920 RepID=UPI00202ED9D8|nr:protein NEDD1-like isoform X2 [Rhincodon typus]
MEETLKLVSAGDCIQIWNLLSFSPETHFNPHDSEQEVSSLCWSSNNQFLVSAASGGDRISVSICKTKPVHLWSIAEQRGQTCVSLNSTMNLILSGGMDSAVNIWDLKTKKLHKSYKGHKAAVTCLTTDWDDQCILSGSLSGDIILHSMLTDEAPTRFYCHSQQPLRDLKISCFQRSLLGSIGDDGSLRIWDINSLQMQHSFDHVHKAPAAALCFSPVIEPLIITVGLDKQISAFDVRSKSVLYSIRADCPLTALELLPDGTALLIGSSWGKVNLYDLRNMEFPVKSSKAHNSAVRCIKLRAVRGKFQAAWPTVWNEVKGGVSSATTTDNTNNVVSTLPSDPSSLQVNAITVTKPSPQFRKAIFLARNSFGEVFSPIRSGQKLNHKTLADMLNTPPGQAGEGGTKEWTISLPKTQLLPNLLKDALEKFSEEHHKEVVGLQLAMIHEFHIQQHAIDEAVLKHLKVSEELLGEYVILKEENERLKVFN